MGAVLKGMELKGGPPLSVPEFVKKHRLAKEHRLPHNFVFKALRYYTGPVRKRAPRFSSPAIGSHVKMYGFSSPAIGSHVKMHGFSSLSH